MTDENKLVSRGNGANGAIELAPVTPRFVSFDLSPRVPRLCGYVLILRKHLWLIVSFMLTGVTIVAIANFRMQPVYVATARIEIDRENANLLPFQGADPYDYTVDFDNYIETQAKILTSETLALQTIRNGGLSDRPEFSGPGGPSEAVASGSLTNQIRPQELGQFLGSLSVKRVPNSRLMDVSFESTDPRLAARIANAHISTYVEQNYRSKYESTTQASNWLADQLSELKVKVQKSEDARIAYERQNQIWTLDDKQNITTQRLSDINKQLTDAQSERMKKESLYQQKAETNQMAGRLVEYNILKREAEANKTLYEGLMTKLKETAISQGLRSSNIRVVDPAMIPSTPARPAKGRDLALGFLVGLVGGIGLALLREYLDNTVKTPDDIETLARLPSLAVVPQFTGSNGHAKRRGLLHGPAANGHEMRIELAAQHLPKSQMSESFRALRTSILLSLADHPPQVILVTSALPREGKTTAAANLAVTLAQLGDSTVIVDADLRKPGIGRLLDLGGGKYAGLSSYLAGVSSLDLVCVPHPTIPNLVAIPTGPIPPNPADLLSSDKLEDGISELRTKFKFIVIDSPPVMAATDAVILSVQADGVLLVVRSGETPKAAFMRTRDLLNSVKCRILGVVLNAVDSSAPDYYYSYHYYPYSYGEGHQEAAEAPHEENSEAVTERVSRDRDDDSEAL